MDELGLFRPLMAPPEAALELMLLEEYLRAEGYTPGAIRLLFPEQVEQLLSEASRHVSCQLAEIETRAKFVREFSLP